MQIDRRVGVLVLSSVQQLNRRHGEAGFFETLASRTVFGWFIGLTFATWEFSKACQILTGLPHSDEIPPFRFDDGDANLLHAAFWHVLKLSFLILRVAVPNRPTLSCDASVFAHNLQNLTPLPMMRQLEAGFAVERPTGYSRLLFYSLIAAAFILEIF